MPATRRLYSTHGKTMRFCHTLLSCVALALTVTSLTSSPVLGLDSCYDLQQRCHGGDWSACSQYNRYCFWGGYCNCIEDGYNPGECAQYCSGYCVCSDLCSVQSIYLSGPSVLLPGETAGYSAYTSPGAPISGWWSWSSSNPQAGQLTPGSSSATFQAGYPNNFTTISATYSSSEVYCPDVTGSTGVAVACPAIGGFNVTISGPSFVVSGDSKDYTASVNPAFPGTLQWSLSDPSAGQLSVDGNRCTFTAAQSGASTQITVAYSLSFGCAGTKTASKPITVLSVDRLEEVSFSGDHQFTVRADPPSSVTYSAPHWQDLSSPPDGDADDPGDRKYPVAFTRNSRMRVSARWNIEPPGPDVNIQIKGNGPGNLDFGPVVASITSSDLTIINAECLNAFGNSVDLLDPMRIDWSFSIDNGTTWHSAGSSANTVYVTLGDPVTATIYHTLLDIGSRNADGNSTLASTTAAIWSEFTDRDVRKVDGTRLHYYLGWSTIRRNGTTFALLYSGDGICSAWARFFIDILKVQGIDNSNDYVLIEPHAPPGFDQNNVGFLVKDWGFSEPGVSHDASYPYLNLPYRSYIGASSYNWMYEDVHDQSGIPGQGSANPESFFNNHQMVTIGGEYYDPSYGAKYSTVSSWRAAALEGFWLFRSAFGVNEPDVVMDLNGDHDMEDLGVLKSAFLIKKGSSGVALDVLIGEY